MKYKKGYQVKDIDCRNRDCFLPYSGNGIKICRLYEMGKCPVEYCEKNVNQNERKGEG